MTWLRTLPERLKRRRSWRVVAGLVLLWLLAEMVGLVAPVKLEVGGKWLPVMAKLDRMPIGVIEPGILPSGHINQQTHVVEYSRQYRMLILPNGQCLQVTIATPAKPPFERQDLDSSGERYLLIGQSDPPNAYIERILAGPILVPYGGKMLWEHIPALPRQSVNLSSYRPFMLIVWLIAFVWLVLEWRDARKAPRRSGSRGHATASNI